MSRVSLDALDLPIAETTGPGRVVPFTTAARRWLQLSLAVIWVIDGLLQFQSFMFTKAFGAQVLAPAAVGNPHWISQSIQWSARIVEGNPVLANAVFASLQLAIGLAIASRRGARVGLAASIIWSLLVWWFGEGLGGLLLPGANALGGAPGAALLYAILAVLVWPVDDSRSDRGGFVAEGLLGAVSARIIWVILWAGLAALTLEPSNRAPQSVHSTVDGMSAGQPAWVNSIVTGFTKLSAHNGVPLAIAGSAVLLLIAVGIFFPPRVVRVVVIVAVVTSAFVWLVGEALGAIFGGEATDVNSGPLLALIALAYWPVAAGERLQV